jgi:hypothetical protein
MKKKANKETNRYFLQLWLTLAERHLEQRGVDWKQAEKVCFNEWSNPDDEELGIQIVKVGVYGIV